MSYLLPKENVTYLASEQKLRLLSIFLSHLHFTNGTQQPRTQSSVFPNMRHCAVTTRQKQTEKQCDTEMAALSLEDTRQSLGIRAHHKSLIENNGLKNTQIYTGRHLE